jgi:uncharacterized protein (TIGR01615 family)
MTNIVLCCFLKFNSCRAESSGEDGTKRIQVGFLLKGSCKELPLEEEEEKEEADVMCVCLYLSVTGAVCLFPDHDGLLVHLFFFMCAGEYEYIDVVFDGEESEDDEESSTDRYILDLDFQAQFEIARPTQQYEAALKSLPTIFVGTSLKLKQVLEIMSNAAKISLKQNAMHLPPWRTLDYMNAKWFSNFERKSSNDLLVSVPFKGPCSSGGGGGSRHRLRWRDNNNHHRFAVVPLEAKLCGEQLRRTKASLLAEVKGAALSNLLPRSSSSSSSRRRSSSQANLMLKEKHFVIEASSIRTKIF